MKIRNLFDIYLEQVSASTRQGIEHFQKMKPEEFINWIKNSGGKLKNIKAVMKIDGLGARFGKDYSGAIFFEGSRTGPVFESGKFSEYAKSKSKDLEVISRAEHYDNMLEIIKKSNFANILPNNCKVICEIFYNPMAEQNGNKIKFVNVQYDKDKLGSLMSIMPYSVVYADNGEIRKDEKEILKKLYKVSNDKFKIINPNLTFKEIDIKLFVDSVNLINDESIELLKSRKKSDKVDKENLLNIIQKIKDDLADYILKHENINGKYKLGDEIEGIVLHIPQSSGNTKPFKITTDTFKEKLKIKQENYKNERNK